MDRLLKNLERVLSHKHMELDKEKLDVFQFPIFQDGQQIDFAVLEEWTYHPPHIHEEGSANLYIITGKGEIILGGKKSNYETGQTFLVPKGTSHGFNTKEYTILLSIQDTPILNKGKLDFKYE